GFLGPVTPSSPLVDSWLSAVSGPRFQHPLSNRACRFPAHGLTMVLRAWLARDSTQCRAGDRDPSHDGDHGTTPERRDVHAARHRASASAVAVRPRTYLCG